jgi:hypothetical protein
MSFKIVDVIKKTKGISGKHKRVLGLGRPTGTKMEPTSSPQKTPLGIVRV